MTHLAPRNVLGLAFGGLLALAVAMGIGRFVYTPILPYMADALGFSAATGGTLASANYLGYLVGALLTSLSRVPGSPRLWFLGGLVASILTTAMMGLTTSIAAFHVIRFVSGVASAFVLVFASTLVLGRLAEAGRTDLSALLFGGVGTGIAVSAILVSVLGAGGASWDQLWLASAAIALPALAAIIVLVPDQRGTPPPPAPPGSRPSPALIALVVAYGLFGFGYVITATFISAMVRGDPALAPAEPYVWATVGLAGAPSIYLWNRIAARIGFAQAFAIACLVEAFGVSLSVLGGGTASILVAAALLGGTFMAITAVGLVEARHLTVGDPRRILAIMTAAFGLGQMIGPSFAGFLREAVGSFTAPTLTAAAALIIAALLVFALTVPERYRALDAKGA